MKNHIWDHNTDTCIDCGTSKQMWLGESEWSALFCQAPPNTPPTVACCDNPSFIYIGSRWVCETCGKNDERDNAAWKAKIIHDPNQYLPVKKALQKEDKCVCGALHTSTPNKHSTWCELRSIK
jgi:hypothetical protein